MLGLFVYLLGINTTEFKFGKELIIVAGKGFIASMNVVHGIAYCA